MEVTEELEETFINDLDTLIKKYRGKLTYLQLIGAINWVSYAIETNKGKVNYELNKTRMNYN